MLTVVCGIITETAQDLGPGGLLLLTQRLPPHPFAGLWNLPGGKVEKDEWEDHALSRELDEELGITKHTILEDVGLIKVENMGPEPFLLKAYTVQLLSAPMPMEGQPMGFFNLKHLPPITYSNQRLLDIWRRKR